MIVCFKKFNDVGDFNAKVGKRTNENEKRAMFQKHPRRLFTWTSPDGNTKNQIDYVLIQQRWKVPSADCDSDHEMLKATFKIRLRTMKRFQMPIRYDTSNVSKEYCIEVSNKFEALNATTGEMRPEELANKAKEIFTEASRHLKLNNKRNKNSYQTRHYKRCKKGE